MPTTEHFAALKMNKLQLKTATRIIMQLMLQEVSQHEAWFHLCEVEKQKR